MNKNLIILIITIIMWTLVIIPTILLCNECIDSYTNGVNIALEGIEIIYGMSAFKSTLSLYISFYFPLFITWISILVISVILSLYLIVKYRKLSYSKKILT